MEDVFVQYAINCCRNVVQHYDIACNWHNESPYTWPSQMYFDYLLWKVVRNMSKALSAPSNLRFLLLVWPPSFEKQAGMKNWWMVNPDAWV